MSGELVLSAVGAGVGVVVWLIRLEGRLNTQVALHKNLADDVAYIRSRIDAALNSRLLWMSTPPKD